METEFTPYVSLIGGFLIGAAAVLLMWARGNVFGATGILSGAITGPDRGWRLTLLAGMISGPPGSINWPPVRCLWCSPRWGGWASWRLAG